MQLTVLPMSDEDTLWQLDYQPEPKIFERTSPTGLHQHNFNVTPAPAFEESHLAIRVTDDRA